jgi:HSP20 family protein
MRMEGTMRSSRLELMHDHVRAIHRGVTGQDPPEPLPSIAAEPPSFEEVSRRFDELEALVRATPGIAERVPAFSFSPPLDLITTARELVIEVGLPGIERDDFDVKLEDGQLTIAGARGAGEALDGRIYLRAEISRGPFHRSVRLPEVVSGAPRIEVANGIIRITLARANRSLLPSA